MQRMQRVQRMPNKLQYIVPLPYRIASQYASSLNTQPYSSATSLSSSQKSGKKENHTRMKENVKIGNGNNMLTLFVLSIDWYYMCQKRREAVRNTIHNECL